MKEGKDCGMVVAEGSPRTTKKDKKSYYRQKFLRKEFRFVILSFKKLKVLKNEKRSKHHKGVERK